MGVRTDVRLETAPMQPVRCERCGADVQVRKSSWDQTSIQWDEHAVTECLERRVKAPAAGPAGGFFVGCTALRDSIRNAAVAGRIDVLVPPEVS